MRLVINLGAHAHCRGPSHMCWVQGVDKTFKKAKVVGDSMDVHGFFRSHITLAVACCALS